MLFDCILLFFLYGDDPQKKFDKEQIEIEKTKIRYCRYVRNWDSQICSDLKKLSNIENVIKQKMNAPKNDKFKCQWSPSK
jgi:hypothetical protein